MFLRRNGNSESHPCLYMGILSDFAISTNECAQYNMIRYSSLQVLNSYMFRHRSDFLRESVEQATVNPKRQSIY
jgi:hypothetical protein